MIKIFAGMFFGIFFVAPALSVPIERMNIDTSGFAQIFTNLGSEIVKITLEVVKQSI